MSLTLQYFYILDYSVSLMLLKLNVVSSVHIDQM